MAFGSDFRTWYSDIPELKKKGEDDGEVLGLLGHTLEAIRLSFYYLFFFQVCMCVLRNCWKKKNKWLRVFIYF